MSQIVPVDPKPAMIPPMYHLMRERIFHMSFTKEPVRAEQDSAFFR